MLGLTVDTFAATHWGLDEVAYARHRNRVERCLDTVAEAIERQAVDGIGLTLDERRGLLIHDLADAAAVTAFEMRAVGSRAMIAKSITDLVLDDCVENRYGGLKEAVGVEVGLRVLNQRRAS